MAQANKVKNIIIIGATSAISQSVVKRVAKPDSNVLLVGRSYEKLNLISNDLKVRGVENTSQHQMDFVNFNEHQGLVKLLNNNFSKIDLVFVSYGIMYPQETCENDASKTIEQLTSNYTSVVSLITSIFPILQKNRMGTIAVVTSVAGDRGRKSNFIYGSAKAGLSVFLEGLRYKLHADGVNVLTIKPGFVDTPMTSELKKGLLWSSPDKVAKYIVKGISKRKSVIYVPSFWFMIMWIIKLIPNFIFRKLNI